MLPDTVPVADMVRGVGLVQNVGSARVAVSGLVPIVAVEAARAVVQDRGAGAGGNPLKYNRGIIREVQAPSSPPG